MKAVKIEIDDGDPKSLETIDVHIFGISLKNCSPTVKFLTMSSGVFIFYLIYGYLQEMIFNIESVRPLGWYVTLVQFVYYTLFASIEISVTQIDRKKAPFTIYLMLAFLTVATMGLSNSSLGYLNYPTQVIFKCCKLIPVLIGGILIQGKKFHILDWLACICMSFGLTAFTLADSSVQPSFSVYGVFLISCALCADALIGNYQEKYMKQYRISNCEMILYSYGFGVIYILIGQIATMQLYTGITVTSNFALTFYGYIFLWSLTGYVGINFVLMLVTSFGALSAVTVTTCRKAVTMVLSFILFPKPFTYQYLWSAVIVVMGIYLNIYSKNRGALNQAMKHYYALLVRSKKRKPSVTLENV